MSTWHPTTQRQRSNRQNERTNQFYPASPSDSAVHGIAQPRRWKKRHRSQPRPTRSATPPPKGDKTHHVASHMASTIWHTVEFSRNRRAPGRISRSILGQPALLYRIPHPCQTGPVLRPLWSRQSASSDDSDLRSDRQGFLNPDRPACAG